MKKLLFVTVLTFLSPGLHAAECISNLSGGSVCGANDFTVEKHAINNPPASCIEGEVLPPITLRVELSSTATQRYDIGFFSGDYGENPIGGASCTVEGLHPLETAGDFDPLSGSGPYRNLDGNGCGDVQKSDGPIVKDFVLDKVLCLDEDENGELDIEYAITWQQSGQASCDPFSPVDLSPPTSSKCLAGEGNIEEIEVLPRPTETSIIVNKAASPSVVTAPGELVEFTVHITNSGTETVTITSLEDDIYGSLRSADLCSVPQMINPGDSYACYFNIFVSGEPGSVHENTITATGHDSNGTETSDSDSAIVVVSGITTGFIGDAVFHDLNANGIRETNEPGIQGVTVELYSQDQTLVPIDTDISDFAGDYGFDGVNPGDYIVSIPRGQRPLNNFVLTTYNVPTEVTLFNANESIDNVDFGFAIAEIDLVKQVDKSVISAPSETVTYTYTMLNTGPVTVYPTDLSDNLVGDLAEFGCQLPPLLEPGNQHSCSVSQTLSGEPGDIIENTAVFIARDVGNYVHAAYASAEVEIEDAANAAIGHTVWHDKNGNGAYDPGEGGFNNVSLDLSGNASAAADTLFGGLYAFLNLLAGDYQVAVTDTLGTLDGYARTTAPGPYLATLQAGQIDLRANFGYARASIDVNKTADPTVMLEPGGTATFTVTVVNDGEAAVELVSLDDTEFGVIDGGNSTCELPQSLAVAASYSCEFTGEVSGSAGTGHANTVTATAFDTSDNEIVASDNALIAFTAPVGGFGDIGFLVWNDADANGAVDAGEQGIGGVTLDLLSGGAIVESGITDLNGRYNFHVANGTYDVEVTDTAGLLVNMGLVSGSNPHTGIVISDNIYIASNFGYAVQPSELLIDVTKTGSTDRVLGSEDVAFTVNVANLSETDVVLTTLQDTVFGDLDGAGDCVTGGTIPAGGSYSCVFVRNVSGTASTPHVNTVRATVTDVFSQTASDADSWTINFGTASLSVSKTADPAALNEPGGSVNFALVIENDGEVPLEITGIEDTVFGALDGGNSTCELPQSLDLGAVYACTFTGDVSGSAGTVHNNTVTVTAEDDAANEVTASDSAAVSIYAPVGGSGDIGYLVWNDVDRDGVVDADEPGIGGVTIDLLSGGSVVQTATTASDGRYTFRVSNGTYDVDVTDTGGQLVGMELVSGTDPHTGIVINDDIYVSANFGYASPLVPPSIEVSKTGSTDRVIVSEDVSFAVDVENLSGTDVILTNLDDTIFGNLDGVGSCAVGGTIPPGGVYSCVFVETVSGAPGDVHTNVVAAAVQDTFGQNAAGSDQWTITFGAASMTVSKTADPAALYEPGGSVTFSLMIQNDGDAPLEITGIEDTVFGALDGGNSTCELPQTLDLGAVYSCTFTGDVNGSAGTVHNNTVTVTAEDAAANEVSASDSAAVSIYAPIGGYGNIGYLVWNDVDRDGVVDADEPGIGGVTIDLLSGGGVVQSATTASDGRYTFRVPNGTYDVVVTDTGVVLGDMELVAGVNPHTGIVISDSFYVAANFGYALPLTAPDITVTKTGSTDAIFDEEDVTFTVEIENTSAGDVELTHLYDSVFGKLDGAGSCAVGGTIAPGETYSCAFTRTLAGEYGDVHSNIVIAAVRDDFGQRAVGADRWIITFFTEPDAIPVLGRGGSALLILLLLGIGMVFARAVPLRGG